MAATDASYQPKVGIEQGATTLYVRSDGIFKFYTTDYTGTELQTLAANMTLIQANLVTTRAANMTLIQANLVTTSIATSAGVLSTTGNFGVGTYYIVMSGASCNDLSGWLTSCVVGNECRIILRDYTAASVQSIFISMSGCSLAGATAADLSSFSLHGSLALAVWHLMDGFT
jgi:hypothetical protein